MKKHIRAAKKRSASFKDVGKPIARERAAALLEIQLTATASLLMLLLRDRLKPKE